MEPATSSSSDDHSVSCSSNFDTPEDFEDLPSEDSCLHDESGTDYDEDDHSSSPSLSHLGNYEKISSSNFKEEDIGEKVHIMRHERGKVVPRSLKEQRKEKALEVAKIRLQTTRKRKKSPMTTSNHEQNTCNSSDDESSDSHDEESTSVQKKKRSKHAPACASSRRSSYFKQTDINRSGLGVQIGANKYKPQDPRFQSLSGYLNQDVFEKRYSFLEEKVDTDIERLQKNISILRQGGKKGKMKRKKLGLETSQLEEDETELKRLLQEKASRRQSYIARAAKQSVKRKIQEDVASGKRGVYYLKRKERKTLEMQARLDELRKVGGEEAVAKALAKRRKKKMSKHSTLMPKVK